MYQNITLDLWTSRLCTMHIKISIINCMHKAKTTSEISYNTTHTSCCCMRNTYIVKYMLHGGFFLGIWNSHDIFSLKLQFMQNISHYIQYSIRCILQLSIDAQKSLVSHTNYCSSLSFRIQHRIYVDRFESHERHCIFMRCSKNIGSAWHFH